MKRKMIIAVSNLILLLTVILAQEPQTLDEQLIRLDTETVLIVPSQAVDEYPIWSPKGDFLAANVEGKWYKINLEKIVLEDATWRGKQKIGVIKSKSSISEASKEEIEAWTKISKLNLRTVTTKSGVKVE